MATISRGYVNLLPPWYFKITLSYIIHVLVLFQVDVFVCRFEIVTNQGPIKLKQVITWRCIPQQKYISIKRKYKIYVQLDKFCEKGRKPLFLLVDQLNEIVL